MASGLAACCDSATSEKWGTVPAQQDAIIMGTARAGSTASKAGPCDPHCSLACKRLACRQKESEGCIACHVAVFSTHEQESVSLRMSWPSSSAIRQILDLLPFTQISKLATLSFGLALKAGEAGRVGKLSAGLMASQDSCNASSLEQFHNQVNPAGAKSDTLIDLTRVQQFQRGLVQGMLLSFC